MSILSNNQQCYKPFHDGGRYHIETNLLIYSALRTGFYMLTASVMKVLNN